MDMVTVATEGDILDSAAEDTIDAILPITDTEGEDITNALQ